MSNEHLQRPAPDWKPWISFPRFAVLPLSHASSCHIEVTSQCNFLFSALVLGLRKAAFPPGPRWQLPPSCPQGLAVMSLCEDGTHLASHSCRDLPKHFLCLLSRDVPKRRLLAGGGGEGGQKAGVEEMGEGALV